jgi:pimeloyl-ACP methyl ester carboxylesterase
MASKAFASFVATLGIAMTLLLAGCASSPTSPQAGGSLAEGQSHFAMLGTNRVYYFTVGKGAHAIVFVHCWAGNSGFWREQVPALVEKARIILIDLPGHGQSDKPRTSYSMDFFASAVVAVMRDAQVDKATLVGHSMGAPVICRAYAQAPEKVAALVAVDGDLRRPAITPEQAEQFLAPFRAPDFREHTTRFLASMFPVPGTEAVRDRVVSEILTTPQYVMVGAMEGMFGPGQPDWDLKKVNVPVVVINAPNPQWTPEYEAYVRGLSPRTEYRVMDGVGHWLMLEKPAAFNAALTDMLRKFDLIAK